MVSRVYVEKKVPHNVDAIKIFNDIRNNLLVSYIEEVRLIVRYDVEGIDGDTFEKAKNTIFTEPMVDTVVESLPDDDGHVVFAVEYLPGQYDQRADSSAQCVQIITGGVKPFVRSAKVYVLVLADGVNKNDIAYDIEKIKAYLINKVEAREASLYEYETLEEKFEIPWTVDILDDFIKLDDDGLKQFLSDFSLAMDFDDIKFTQEYFKNEEQRDPTVTEIRMIDTYWSDHCRHTTFLTAITDVEIDNESVKEAFLEYLDIRKEVYGDKKKNVTLMDIATISAKYLKKIGKLDRLDESEEINACSVKIKVDVNGTYEDYLLMFKNETHNHPTEIEPFGGAATCLGGAIRDPLSGRSYVYQAMRVTGAADPRMPVNDTMKGKLPQSKITIAASNGYSSYGNQIGLATGGVFEVYHPDYVAKRLEVGAVIGAVPAENVKREVPSPGDSIILLGGRTGRDGCGGATGSSKSHTSESIETCGAEVQKGNPIEERKIQRLFRNPEAASLIKRCNDFGAGGVSVAIGELADSIFIDLSLVPKKYEGLDGTELAISESQERMAVVVAAADADRFIRLANGENIEATKVATVTDDKRLRMAWNNNQILSIKRDFLNSNGASKTTAVEVPACSGEDISLIMYNKIKDESLQKTYCNLLSDLSICSQKGLVEKFDSSIGAATVISPFGGSLRLSPSQYMAAKIPVLNGKTDTASLMAHGFSPYISKANPFLGAMYAVVESVTKLVCAGVEPNDIYLSLQEYFPRTKNNPKLFGLPFEALLGAMIAQIKLGIAAIGGKDSMSGSYSYENESGDTVNIDVPPTLVSFAVGTANASAVISNEFKKPSSFVYLLKPLYKKDNSVDFEDLKNLYKYINKLIENKYVLSSYSIGYGGIAEAVFKMGIGNGIGVQIDANMPELLFFASLYGSVIIESDREIPNGELIGKTIAASEINVNNQKFNLNDLSNKWLAPLENVFSTGLYEIPEASKINVPKFVYTQRNMYTSAEKFLRPRALINVFPGTNCEYDTARQLNEAGAASDVFVFRNLNSEMIHDSINTLVNKINESQIFMLPGGFSGGDEPDGSAKFIVSVLRNPKVSQALTDLIEVRGGLVLGICNGFQALVKLGLLPYGKIKETMDENDPTLSFNKIGRHQSYIAYTRIASVKSPWLFGVNAGEVHAIPISHGEGRFCVSDSQLAELAENGQIAAQYVDLSGEPTMNPYYNPNFSEAAIEGILSPDGRIFGKMGHSERIGKNIMKNVPGNTSQRIFESGVRYFK